MPEDSYKERIKWALIGAYALGITGLLYPLAWTPAWELARGLAEVIKQVPWSDKSVRTIVLVTFVLTITGGLGGLALQIGRGGIVFPRITTSDKGVRSLEPGVFGEVILGALAGNALHFPFAAMVQYKALAEKETATQSWLTLAALGILGGYAGGVLLKRWSDSLVASLEKGIEQNKKIAEQALHESEKLKKQRQQDEDDILFQAIADAAITSKRLDTTASTILTKRANLVIAEEKERGLDSVEPIDALFAAYRLFGNRAYRDATRFLEHTAKAKHDGVKTWSIENLLGLCYHYQDEQISDWYEKAKERFETAIRISPDSTRAMVPRVNLGFLEFDKNQPDVALRHFNLVRQARGALADYPKIADIASLGAAIVHASKDEEPLWTQALAEIKDIGALEYLFKDGTVKSEVLEKWKGAADRLPAFQALLTKLQ